MKPRSKHHKRTKRTGRKPCPGSVTYQITTTTKLIEVLDLVVATGFFGGNRSTASERLLAESLRGLLREGVIQKRKKAIEP